MEQASKRVDTDVLLRKVAADIPHLWNEFHPGHISYTGRIATRQTERIKTIFSHVRVVAGIKEGAVEVLLDRNARAGLRVARDQVSKLVIDLQAGNAATDRATNRVLIDIGAADQHV